ncbi:putative MFS transporter superfamily [Helianthus debilis subsp. tardiflorus]
MLVVMYSLTFFFANFRPNSSSTFVVPGENFPARLCSTCHGISAADEKAGNIVEANGFLYASQSTDPKKTDDDYHTGIGIWYTLIILGVVNALGLLFTFLAPEPSDKSLEETGIYRFLQKNTSAVLILNHKRYSCKLTYD